MQIILASASPRRKDILTEAGVDFKIIPSLAEEDAPKTLCPKSFAEWNARQKAEEVFNAHGGVVLGADTIVVLDGKILGKPKDREDAVKMLSSLSGRAHTVITGFCVIYGGKCKKQVVKSVGSEVLFNELSKELIDSYVSSGKCMDKAGSYGIQDGYELVKEVKGSLANVIGLPIDEVLDVLKEIENEED